VLDSARATGEEKALLNELAFSSPVNLSALLDEGDDDGAAEPAREAGFRLWEHLRSLDSVRPCILETTVDQQPYPVILHGFSYSEFSTLLGAMESLAGGTGRSISPKDRALERLEKSLHQARGRAKGIGRELARGPDPEELRGLANLLLARLGEVPKGASRTELTGFEGEPVVIPLDPSKTPQENAADLYREAGRVDRARERLPLLLETVRKKVEDLEVLRDDLLQGNVTPEEAETRIPGKAKTTGRPGRPEEERRPYLRFRSSGGLEIRVGRGSGDNDALTFRHSRPEDIWLHAREVSGAHVILRWSGPEGPPARDLTEAAVLAAVHSRARGSGVIPVDWTRRKHVRKPRKAHPGTVIPQETQTIFVEPDPELPKRLRWED